MICMEQRHKKYNKIICPECKNDTLYTSAYVHICSVCHTDLSNFTGMRKYKQLRVRYHIKGVLE